MLGTFFKLKFPIIGTYRPRGCLRDIPDIRGESLRVPGRIFREFRGGRGRLNMLCLDLHTGKSALIFSPIPYLSYYVMCAAILRIHNSNIYEFALGARSNPIYIPPPPRASFYYYWPGEGPSSH